MQSATTPLDSLMLPARCTCRQNQVVQRAVQTKFLHLHPPVTASSSHTSWFLPTLKFVLPSEVCRQLAIPEEGAPLTPAGWTMCSLCAQDKAGAVRQSGGPWGRTHEQWHTSVLRCQNQLLDTELITAAPQEKTHFLWLNLNAFLQKLRTNQMHFCTNLYLDCSAGNSLPYLAGQLHTCGKKTPVLLTQGFTGIISHKANPSGAEHMQPGQGYVKFLFYQKV